MSNPMLVRSVPEGISQAIKDTEDAWQQFVVWENIPPHGRPFVLDSWRRCQAEHIPPHLAAAQRLVKESLVDELWDNHPLHDALAPYFQTLTDTMHPSRHLVVFTDASGLILRIVGESFVRQAAEKMNFVPGSNWQESQAGTNAIGTSLQLGTPVQIFAAEHYCAPVHQWTCSAAPITDPATRQVLGVIDLTGFREYHHPHSLAVVQSIARAVEDHLRDQLELERFTIFGEYLELSARHPDTLLIALDRGGQVIRCSSAIWDQGWIDSQNQLKHLPADYARLDDGASWELEGLHERWKCILHHCYRQHQRIGAIIQAVPCLSPVRKKAVSAPRSSAPAKEDSHMTLATFHSLIGRSPAFLKAVGEAQDIARSEAPVLLLGETGTGKELMAQAIHSASRFAAGPFVAVNCGAIPPDLIGSELFGFEGGSFTGAAREGRPGKFELADGGTIFLDEIGELPLALQPYLLRVLDLGETTRIGGQSARRLNLRVIAATNQNLEAMVERGAFRRDLFYRLNVLPIVLPPVRERPGDAIELFEHFLRRAAQRAGRQPWAIAPEVALVFDRYPWTGNVREIRNLAERLAATLPHRQAIAVQDLPATFRDALRDIRRIHSPEELREQEWAWIQRVLEECGGNRTLAAERLGIHRSTLYRKIRRHHTSAGEPGRVLLTPHDLPARRS
ncbi:MAG: sigma-54-dependent Fis family transcriptional regulator [Firmicutes bacterium]|nr:sigma-54-dependent Fis family transcriptional regulator [Bacillota bacterium]